MTIDDILLRFTLYVDVPDLFGTGLAIDLASFAGAEMVGVGRLQETWTFLDRQGRIVWRSVPVVAPTDGVALFPPGDPLSPIPWQRSVVLLGIDTYVFAIVAPAKTISVREWEHYRGLFLVLYEGICRVDTYRKEAMVDALTGLPTRRIVEETLANPLSYPLYIVYIDANDLKRINDTQGHDAGDRYLCALAEQISESFREPRGGHVGDIVARVGGDEFVAIVRQANLARGGQDAIEQRLQRLSERLGERIAYGYAYARTSAEAKEAMRAADERMYRHKAEIKARRARAALAG